MYKPYYNKAVFNSVSTKEPPQRRTWSDGEKDVVLQCFQSQILRGKLPGKDEIMALLNTNPVLKDRTWTNVKDFVRNHLKNLSKSAL